MAEKCCGCIVLKPGCYYIGFLHLLIAMGAFPTSTLKCHPPSVINVLLFLNIVLGVICFMGGMYFIVGLCVDDEYATILFTKIQIATIVACILAILILYFGEGTPKKKKMKCPSMTWACLKIFIAILLEGYFIFVVYTYRRIENQGLDDDEDEDDVSKNEKL